MLTLKIAGGALIIGATTLMGVFCSRREATRERELLEMKRALTILKNEIRFLLTPFGEAMITVSERIDSPVCALFAAAGAEALKKTGRGADEIWQSAVAGIEDYSYYSREDIEAIKSLGKSICALDTQMQSQSADLLIEYIDGAVASIREREPRQSKLYRSLGVLSGVLLTVLLI